MSAITWIIIVLIVISICVTVTEVALRFGILTKERGSGNVIATPNGTILEPGWIAVRSNATLEELRSWGVTLSEEERTAVCGAQYIGTTFAGI